MHAEAAAAAASSSSSSSSSKAAAHAESAAAAARSSSSSGAAALDPFDDSLFQEEEEEEEEEDEEDEEEDEEGEGKGAEEGALRMPALPPSLEDADDAHFRAYHKRDPWLLAHKAIYFLGMGANAAYFPFAVQWWTSPNVGLSIQEAGVVFAVAHMCTLFASPLVMRLADQSEGWRRGLLVASIVAQIALLGIMSNCRSFAAVLCVEILQECAACAIWPSMDAATQRLLEVVHGSTAQYGNTRAIGALGWGVCAWVFGAFFDRYGMDIWWRLFAVTFAPAVALALLVPMERRSASRVDNRELVRRLVRWDVAVVLLVVLLTAVLLQIVDVYRFPFLASLPGCSNELLGLSITATAVSEVPFFFITSWILARMSVSWALCIVLAGYAVRYIYYSLIYNTWLSFWVSSKASAPAKKKEL